MNTKLLRLPSRLVQRVLCCTSIILASYNPAFVQGPGSYTPVSLTFSPSAVANGFILAIGLAWNIYESDVLGLVATGEFSKILVKTNDDGPADGALKAIFSAWSDQSLRDEFSEARYSGGVEVRLLQLSALRFGRHWDGFTDYGYNTFGYSIGPPGFRFSFEKYSPFESLFNVDDEWHVYTALVMVNKLPQKAATRAGGKNFP